MSDLISPEQRERREALREKRRQVGSITRLSPEDRQELMQLESIKSNPDVFDSLRGMMQSHKEFSDARAKKALGPKDAEVAPSVAALQDAAKPLAPATTPAADTAAVVTPPAGGADDSGKQVKEPNLLNEYTTLLNDYKGLGASEQKALKASYDELNSTIGELNAGFERDMAEAKDKSEKQKTRAEWAGIASILAKNIIGFAAAQQGVSPQAMGYDTTDWQARITGIESNLKNELAGLRETMRDKVNAKKFGVDGAEKLADVGLKGKMAELEARKDMLRTKLQNEADMEKEQIRADGKEAAAEARGRDSERLAGPGKDLTDAIGQAASSKTAAGGFAKLKALAVQYGVNPSEIDTIAKKYQGTFDIGSPNQLNPEAQSEVAQLFEGRTKSSRTTTMPVSTGQAVAPVVQSGGMVTITDVASGKSKQYPANSPAVANARNNPKFKVE